jgi:hypothetical protein
MNDQSCVAASAKSSIDGKFGGSASRCRNAVGREQQQSYDSGKSNYHC